MPLPHVQPSRKENRRRDTSASPSPLSLSLSLSLSLRAKAAAAARALALSTSGCCAVCVLRVDMLPPPHPLPRCRHGAPPLFVP